MPFFAIRFVLIAKLSDSDGRFEIRDYEGDFEDVLAYRRVWVSEYRERLGPDTGWAFLRWKLTPQSGASMYLLPIRERS